MCAPCPARGDLRTRGAAPRVPAAGRRGVGNGALKRSRDGLADRMAAGLAAQQKGELYCLHCTDVYCRAIIRFLVSCI